MNPIPLYIILGLSVLLVGSGVGHYVQHQHVVAAEAREALATAGTATAVDANAATQKSLDTFKGELEKCQSEASHNATANELAKDIAAEIERNARNRAAADAKRRARALLESPACLANADLPVCPDLLGTP